MICGRLNKPNHNIICALKPNKKRKEYDKFMENLSDKQTPSE